MTRRRFFCVLTRTLGRGLLLWPAGVCAQWAADVEGPRLFRLRVSEIAAEFKVEAQHDQRTNRGEPLRRDYLFVEPSVGVDLRGSFYHPNLVEFQFRPELGASGQTMRLDPPDESRRANRPLARFDGRVTVLREKPFATQLFAESGQGYRDLDFFSRAHVEHVRFGVHSGYSQGRAPFTVDAVHLAEQVGGGHGRASEVAGNTFSVAASQEPRKAHKTSFAYVLNTYNRKEEGLAPNAGRVHNLSLLDTRRWGADEWLTLNSIGLYHQLGSSQAHTRSVTLLEHLGLQFQPELAGELHYDFGRQRSDAVATYTHEARTAVRHQLFKSLTSALVLQGGTQGARSRPTRQDGSRVGVAVEESYSKRLPGRSWLQVSANWRHDRHQRRTAGEVLSVADERLTLSDRKTALLSQADILEVGRVTTVLGIVLAEQLDYVLVRHGTLLEVRRVPGGNIPEGGQVLVSYTATALPTDRYASTAQVYDCRLDFFGGLVALYSRINTVDHVGGRSVVLRDLADRLVGAEVAWRWCAVGVERETLDSNLSPLHARRFYESCAIDLGFHSTLTVNLDQGWTLYPDTGRVRVSRSRIGRFQNQLTPAFAWQVEGGVRRERGEGIDQDRTALRASCSYAYGRLTLHASYEFDDENLLGELHRRRQAVLRLRRTF